MDVSTEFVIEVSGPESNLDICVNGFSVRKQTPSTMQLRVGDIVFPDGIWNGAWVVSGREKYIKFKMSKFSHGLRLYADTGDGDVLLGYRVDPSITQHRLNEIVLSTQPMRVLYFVAPPKGGLKNITSIATLSGRSDLWAISLFGTLVTDVSALRNLSELRYLNLKWTLVSDISPLANLTELRWLSLWGTRADNLKALVGLQKLGMLNLRKTKVTDLAPIVSLERLIGLNLWGVPITDISPLAKLKNLKWLYLQETKVPTAEIAKLISQLPNCHVEG